MERLCNLDSEDSYREATREDLEDTENVMRLGVQSNSSNGSVSQISVTGLTGGNAETVTAVGILHGNILVSNDHRMKSLKEKTNSEICYWTKEMFLRSCVKEVVEKVKAGHDWINVTGNAGEGKTTAGYLSLQQLVQEKYQVFKVDTPEDYFTIARKMPNSVILLNDVLGAFGFDPSALSRWEPVFHHFLDMSANQGEYRLCCIIFVSRNNVVEGARRLLGRYEKDMFRTDNTVNLSIMSQQSMKENLEILNLHLTRSGIEDVAEETKKKIVSGSCPHGFPHCCKMYTCLRKTNTKVLDIEQFFARPLLFLAQTTTVLIENPQVRALLKEMLKNRGTLTMELHDVRRDDLKRPVDELMGSYLKHQGEKIGFAHSSIYESVAFCIGHRDPLFAVQNFDLSFILQKVRLINGNDPSSDTSKIHHLSIETTQKIIEQLCQRFSSAILMKDFSILQHVCSELISNCIENKNVKQKLKNFFKNKGHKKIDVDCRDKKGNTLLHVAHRSQNENAVEILLRFGADVNIRDDHNCKWGNNFFHLSCMNTPVNCNLIETLINHGADVNARFADGNSALHYMYHHKEKETFDILIENGADVNLSDVSGRTVLQLMCKDGACRDDIKVLLDHGANVNHSWIPFSKTIENDDTGSESEGEPLKNPNGIGIWKGRKGKTALHYLCRNNAERNDIKLLIQHGAQVNKTDKKGRTPLHYACGFAHLESMKCLLYHGANVNAADNEGNTPLHYLYETSNTEGIANLLENGADVNRVSSKGKAILHYHCETGKLDLEFLQLLLKHGVDVNMRKSVSKGKTALHYVSKRRDVDGKYTVIEMLVKHGASVNMVDNKGKTPLHYVSETGDDQTFNLLVEYGSDASVADNAGIMVLHNMYENGQTGRLMTILRRGSNVNKTDRKGKTLLHYICVCEGTDLSLLHLLFQNGADVNKRRKYRSSCEDDITRQSNQLIKSLKGGGKTPLHYACNKVKVTMAVVVKLLNHGSSVNMTDRHRMTPLHYLLLNEDTSVDDLTLMLTFGADIRKVNILGQSVLHFACSRRNVDCDILEILVKYGANPINTDKEGRRAIDYLGKSDSDKRARDILEKN